MVEVVGSSPIVPTSILDLSEVLEQIPSKSGLYLKRSVEALSEWKRSCGFHFCFLDSVDKKSSFLTSSELAVSPPHFYLHAALHLWEHFAIRTDSVRPSPRQNQPDPGGYFPIQPQNLYQ
jgi:hypothetical protein